MGKLSRETPPPREGEPMGARRGVLFCSVQGLNQKCTHSLNKSGRLTTLEVEGLSTLESSQLPYQEYCIIPGSLLH